MLREHYFCLSKNVYEVIGVYRSSWKPQPLDTAAAYVTRKEPKEPKPEPRAAGVPSVPVDDAINITAHHLPNTALQCTINHINTKEKTTNQPTSNPQNPCFNNGVRKYFAYNSQNSQNPVPEPEKNATNIRMHARTKTTLAEITWHFLAVAVDGIFWLVTFGGFSI